MFQNYVSRKFISILKPRCFSMKFQNVSKLLLPRRLQEEKKSTFYKRSSNLVHKCSLFSETIIAHKSNRWNKTRRLLGTSSSTSNKINQIPSIIGDFRIWGTAGVLTYLSSTMLGNVTYALAAIPIIYNYNSILTGFSTLRRDLTFTQRITRASMLNKLLAFKNATVPECFEAIAKPRSNDTMILFEDTKWTYNQIEMLSNKVTNHFQTGRYEKGDIVALLIGNRPELVAIILGLSKIGVIVAIFDPSCKDSALQNSLKMIECKSIIASDNLIPELQKIKIDPNVTIFDLDGKSKKYENLNKKLQSASYDPIEIIQKVKHTDPLAYIFTLDCNSHPKAAVLTHQKFIKNVLNLTFILNLQKCNIYNPLPIQQTIGLIAGVGPSIICGIPVVLKRKFSPEKYFSDCVKYNCNIGLYNGTICSDLMSLPPSKEEKSNALKKMIGIGMPSTMWKEFVKRYNVEVTELYGPTEENCSLINPDGKLGAVGFIPSYLPKFLHPIAIIEAHPITLEPIRNEEGFCKKSNTGLLIEMLNKKKKRKYLINKANFETNKIIENVFKNGDMAIVTNDIVTMDKFGYLYFTEHPGEDTYNWKGEVVITSEVESFISNLINSSCVVYGVKVPNTQEKAGMAVIDDFNCKLNFERLANDINNGLPGHARPVFLRVKHESENFSKSKEAYASEGYNPVGTKDDIYYLNSSTSQYELVNPEIYRKIVESEINF